MEEEKEQSQREQDTGGRKAGAVRRRKKRKSAAGRASLAHEHRGSRKWGCVKPKGGGFLSWELCLLPFSDHGDKILTYSHAQ